MSATRGHAGDEDETASATDAAVTSLVVIPPAA